MEGAVAPVGDVLVDVQGVYVAGVAQGDAGFHGSHGVLVQVLHGRGTGAVGQAFYVAQIAQGQVFIGGPAGYVAGGNLPGSLGVDVGVKDSRSAGELDVYQRLGEAQAQAAHPADAGGRVVPPQGLGQCLEHRVGAGGLAAHGRTYANPGAVSGIKRLPTNLCLLLEFLKAACHQGAVPGVRAGSSDGPPECMGGA